MIQLILIVAGIPLFLFGGFLVFLLVVGANVVSSDRTYNLPTGLWRDDEADPWPWRAGEDPGLSSQAADASLEEEPRPWWAGAESGSPSQDVGADRLLRRGGRHQPRGFGERIVARLLLSDRQLRDLQRPRVPRVTIREVLAMAGEALGRLRASDKAPSVSSGQGITTGWRIMRLLGKLMPAEAAVRWLGEAESFMAEADPRLQRSAMRSYLTGAPQVILASWSSPLGRRVRGPRSGSAPWREP